MQLTFKRNTGFYAMGSPLTVTKNNKKWFLLNQNEQVNKEMTETEISVQVSFYLLKSKPKFIQNDGQEHFFEVRMNPAFQYSYLVLFGLMLLLPVVYRSFLGSILIVLIFIGFMLVFFKQAYVIEEFENGK